MRPVSPATVIQLKPHCSCGGACPQCQAEQALQPKLKIGAPDDKYEREADRVADQVMRMPRQEGPWVQAAPPETSLIQRQDLEEESELPAGETPSEEEEEEEDLQAKAAPGRTPVPGSDTQARIQSLRGGGQPLPPSTRQFFESRLGRDFSNVRIHSNSQAATAAQSVNARAFTVGNDVVFNNGEYAPDSDSGKRLLAHELTHVVQQGGVPKAVQRKELHFYDPTDNWGRLMGYAKHYCANYKWLTKQCLKRKPGKLHAAAYTVAGVVQRIRLFKSHGHKIHGIVFHGHGGPGYINLAKESLDANSARQLAAVSNLLQPSATVEFMGCEVAKGQKGRRFLIAIGRNLLRAFGGRVCGSKVTTYSTPFLGQTVFKWPWTSAKSLVKCYRFGPFQGRRPGP